MDPKIEDAQGRVKEAVGTLTGNEDLKAEGAADQAEAKVNKAADDLAKSAKRVVSDVADKAEGAIDSVKDALK